MMLIPKYSHLLPSYAASHCNTLISTSHHLLTRLLCFSAAKSQTAPPKPPFCSLEYLMNSCGLPSDKAIKASQRLTHLKSPSNPDSVIRFLKQSGLSDTHISNLISLHPRLLCANVERTLKPKFRALQELGFSESETVQLVGECPVALRYRDLQPKIEFWRGFFGTNQQLLKVIKRNYYLLASSLGERTMPNISLLRECGLSDHQIAMITLRGRLILRRLDSIKALIRLVEELGVAPGSGNFSSALQTVSSMSRTKIKSKLGLLRSLGCSEAEVKSGIQKSPMLLALSEKNIQDTMDFLTEKAGCEPSYVMLRPALLGYSLERRLIPRHRILQILKSKELTVGGINLFNAMWITDEKFLQKFVLPHKEKAPEVYEAYVAACAGNVPV